MSDKVTVTVEGVAEALKNLKRYQLVKREAVKMVLKRYAFKIELAAKEMVPVDYGRLRASITVNWAGSPMGRASIKSPSRAKENPSMPDDAIGRPTGAKDYVFVVGSNVVYAPAIEHGTKRMAAQPYLYPAYFMFEGEIVKDVGKIFKKDIRLK